MTEDCAVVRVLWAKAGMPPALLLLAMLTAGCFKTDIVLTVSPNATVDGTVLMAYDRGALSGLNLTEEDAKEQILGDLEDDAGPGFSCEAWDDDTYVGARCQLAGVTLDDLSAAEAFDHHLTLVRDGDELRVSGAIDLSDLPPRPTSTMANFDCTLRITFPGPVLDQTNGQVEGQTVTWQPDPGSRTEIRAVARARESFDGFGALPLWAGGLAVLAVIAASVLVLAGQRRRT